MDVKVKEKGGNRASFNVSGVDINLVNALRRNVISEIPTMAIESVTFLENSSILNDEMLGLRLGLTPLKTDLKTYNTLPECTCDSEGCAKCTAVLTLDVKGPGVVYSKQMKSNDPEVGPVHENVPLAKLTEGQHIKFEARARLGTGKEHMKWQAGLAGYEIQEDGSVDMFVESFNQLELPQLMEESVKIFTNKIDELKAALK